MAASDRGCFWLCPFPACGCRAVRVSGCGCWMWLFLSMFALGCGHCLMGLWLFLAVANSGYACFQLQLVPVVACLGTATLSSWILGSRDASTSSSAEPWELSSSEELHNPHNAIKSPWQRQPQKISLATRGRPKWPPMPLMGVLEGLEFTAAQAII